MIDERVELARQVVPSDDQELLSRFDKIVAEADTRTETTDRSSAGPRTTESPAEPSDDGATVGERSPGDEDRDRTSSRGDGEAGTTSTTETVTGSTDSPDR